MERWSSTLVLLLCATFTGTNAQDCPPLSGGDLGNSSQLSRSGLVAKSFTLMGEGSEAPLVQIFNYTVVCEVAGFTPNTARGVSVLVHFDCESTRSDIEVLCTPEVDLVIRQFQFSCSQGEWVPSVAGTNAFVTSATTMATLDTQLDDNCGLCADPDQFPPADPVTHCLACNPSCNQGQMRCFGPEANECCNFYQDGQCVDQCADGLVPNAAFQCVCPGLPNPENGLVSSTEMAMIGESVTYSCFGEFFLVGLDTRTCTANGWSGSEPTCSLMVECYTDRVCSEETSPLLMTRRECCVDTPEAVGFKILEGSEVCFICTVFGFFQTSFSAVEQGQGYALQVGYIKRPDNNVIALTFDVGEELVTASPSDFTLQTAGILAIIPSAQSRDVTFTFRVDAIAQEMNETVTLRLNATNAVMTRFGSELNNNAFFLDTAELTIIDSDSLELSFTEEDYRSSEPDLFVNVEVTKNSRIATPVTVRVTPVTFSQHRTTGRDFPSQPAEDLFDDELGITLSPIEADLDDFDNTPIVVTFPADETFPVAMNDINTPVPIINDTINEAEEQDFIVTLNVIDAADRSKLTVTRPDALCRIIDDDVISIGFERPSYTFPEPPGPEGSQFNIQDVIFLVKEGGVMSEQTFLVVMTVTDSTPSQNILVADRRDNDNFNDYEIPGTNRSDFLFVVNSNEQTRPFNFRLFGDDIAEGPEGFQVSSAVRENSPSFLPPNQLFPSTFIIIEDNDNVIIGFERNYTIDESVGTQEICAVVIFPAPDVPIPTAILSVNTIPGTADELDYDGIAESDFLVFLSFDDTNRRQCFPLTIVNDEAVEDTERLTIELVPSSFLELSSSVILDPNVTTIEIIDNDAFIEVGWEQPEYNVDETDGLVQLCAVMTIPALNEAVDSDVELFLTVTTGDVTAVEDFDYASLDGELIGPFNNGNRRACVEVNITDDRVPELTESFVAVLEAIPQSMNPAPELVTIRPDVATINIMENDVPIEVGWERTLYNVNESSGEVELCAVITVPPADVEIQISDFNLSVSTQQLTAEAGVDYVSLSGQILGPFGDGNRRSCVLVTIVDDMDPEDTETFTGVLEHLPGDTSQRVTITPNTTRVNIEDMDGPTAPPAPPVNDTIVGDPLLTAPLLITDRTALGDISPDEPINLCYEVRARPDAVFNLVSDTCVTVNAHYAQVRPDERLNIINAVYVRAVDSEGNCHNITVDLDQCTPSVNLTEVQMLNTNGVYVRRMRNRVRIAVPNCRDQDLVMWVFCQNRTVYSTVNEGETFTVEMIRFVISRGFSLQESSHGILGQFWNVPVDIERFNQTLVTGADPGSNAYALTVNYPGGPPRVFVGWLFRITWEKRHEYCIYAGNGQGGQTFEVPDPYNDPVLEGRYSDYMVDSPFDSEFEFNHFEESRCD